MSRPVPLLAALTLRQTVMHAYKLVPPRLPVKPGPPSYPKADETRIALYEDDEYRYLIRN
jgi:hypothetical protein